MHFLRHIPVVGIEFESSICSSKRAQEIIRQSMGRARVTLADARRAIDDLRSEQAGPEALAEVISREVEQFIITTGMPCELEVELPANMDQVTSEHVQRVVVEGLRNIARHAQAIGPISPVIFYSFRMLVIPVPNVVRSSP